MKDGQHRRLRYALATVVAALALAFGGGTAQAGPLVGVTGDGAIVRESLYYLSTTNAASTFIMNLGAGNDGETIAFNPVNGLLYHASGISNGNRFWESINVGTATIVTSTPLVMSDEGLGLTYNASTGGFLLTSRDNNVFYDVTVAGTATDIGSTPEDLKGLAFVSGSLYGGSVFSNRLYKLNPLDGSVISSVGVTLGGNAISGVNGLATDPDTGLLWGIIRQGVTRRLGTIDVNTGVATTVGTLSDNFAGIAFLQDATTAVPEPASLTLVGLTALGIAGYGWRRRNQARLVQNVA
jgi:hypothetical protein